MKKIRYYIYTAAVFLFIFLLIGAGLSENAQKAVREGLKLCADGLVPSLFISMTVTAYINRSGLWQYLSKPLGSFAKHIFGFPEKYGFAIISGYIFGFPSSALCCNEISEREDGDIHSRIIALGSLPSPAFVIGYVGGKLFSDVRLGLALYAVQIMSSVTVGALMKKPYRTQSENVKRVPLRLVRAMTGAVSDSAATTTVMCAFVIFFSTLAKVTASHLPALFGKILLGIAEISAGCQSAVSINSIIPSAVFVSAVLSFSGISVLFQLMNAYDGLSVKKYILIKLLMTAFSAAYTYILTALPCIFSSLTVFAVCAFLYGKELINSRKNEHDTESLFESGTADTACDE